MFRRVIVTLILASSLSVMMPASAEPTAETCRDLRRSMDVYWTLYGFWRDRRDIACYGSPSNPTDCAAATAQMQHAFNQWQQARYLWTTQCS